MKKMMMMMMMMMSLSGCFRGMPSDKPPIHINPNMDHQPKFNAQSANPFFADGAAMRVPPAGTVAQGKLHEDDAFWRGIDSTSGAALTMSPVPVTTEGLKRGQERYNIYCSVCHGQTGDGKGIMLKKGYVPPPSFHSDLIRGYPDGQIFKTISDGVRNMPAYKSQIPVADRWLIVNYLRALQRSQHATIADVPSEERGRIGG
jgi:mono/diheme cytochrome c family protein